MFKKLFLSLSLIIALPFAANASTPKEYAQTLSDKVISIVESKSTDQVKENQLIDMFKGNVDTDWMARFTMGKYFRTLTPAQMKEYQGLYRDYVIYSYIPKFRMYSGERMDVTQVIDEGEGFYTVKTTLKTKKSSTGSVLVDYKLKANGGSFRIVDVIGEGVSLINTQRSDFSTPLAEQGVDAFLARLTEKVKALKANPPTGVEKKAAK